MNNIFFFEIFFFEIFGNRCFLVVPIFGEGIKLFCEVATFQVKDTASLCVASDSQLVACQIGDFG